MRARLTGVLVALLLLPACGLPLPEGVQSAGDVQPVRDEPGALRVIPPGPQPGASPEQIVRGFLLAQSSPDEDHARAREFLAPGAKWDDEQGAVIYREKELGPDDDGDPLTFSVRFEPTARIQPTGGVTLDTMPVDVPFVVARMPSGEYRLTQVPNGLYLTEAERERSFEPYDVYFLARGLDGRPTERLVPEPVFVPETADRASALVAALLLGPTVPLIAAVETAIPPATKLTAPVGVGDDNVVTVDLTAEARALSQPQRQRLAAQFVWTLVPAFTGVRLLVERAPLEIDGAGEVMTRTDWRDFDPVGISPSAPLYYVQDRKLRSLDSTLPDNPATRPGPFVVDEVAVSPADGAVGLLSRSAGMDAVRIGTVDGPFGEPVLRRPDLASLSWGPGEQGLWLIERGRTPSICLLAPPDAPQRPDPCDITYDRPPGAGELSALQVSRDGARAALIFGTGEGRQLYVGQIVPAAGGPRIAVSPDPVAPVLRNVTDVAWQSGTSLAVLAAPSPGETQVVLLTVDVNGATRPVVFQRQGIEGEPRSVAAAPGRPLVVSADVDGQSRLYRDSGQLFKDVAQGSQPAYPG